MNIAVGSKNPVKVEAGRLAFTQLNGGEVEVEGFNVPSGVSDQPVGGSETKQGALNRAMKSYEEYMAKHGSPPDFACGMEGGIDGMAEGETMVCFAVMCVYDGQRTGYARTATFDLPEQIGVLVRGGMEVGALTNGLISRTDYYVPAIVLAYVPFNFPSLYPQN